MGKLSTVEGVKIRGFYRGLVELRELYERKCKNECEENTDVVRVDIRNCFRGAYLGRKKQRENK